MEFKGTKVFPKYVGGDNYSVDLIFDNGATISIDRRCRYSDNVVCERSEMEANALLISKAPEMLDEIHESITDLLCLQGSVLQSSKTDHRWDGIYDLIQKQIDRKKQLIKEATEI